jgi:SAM-dependent methyltransferase
MLFDNDSFDMVVGWMVVEHLHDPVAGLKKVADVLKPGGYFAFSIPNTGSWELKLFKSRWYALHLPCHLYHYDINSISTLLQRVGLSVENVIYQRNINNIIGSLWHLFEDTTGESYLTRLFRKWTKVNPEWLQLIFSPVIITLSFLRQGGRVTIWARKDAEDFTGKRAI